VLAAHPPKQEDTEFGETLTRGVPVRLRIVREQAVGDVDLGERSRFWPSDEALAQWAAQCGAQSQLVYTDDSAG
jgi:DNA polymerase-3 subunit alpha